MATTLDVTFYLFAGSNVKGKTTGARRQGGCFLSNHLKK
jgi:hypothetical protein